MEQKRLGYTRWRKLSLGEMRLEKEQLEKQRVVENDSDKRALNMSCRYNMC